MSAISPKQSNYRIFSLIAHTKDRYQENCTPKKSKEKIWLLKVKLVKSILSIIRHQRNRVSTSNPSQPKEETAEAVEEAMLKAPLLSSSII